VSGENAYFDESDNFPHCKRPLEIAALSVFRPSIALFVCAGCGLAMTESRDEARRKLRQRVVILDRMLDELNSLIARSPTQTRHPRGKLN
jgi:hypothetical protein